MVPRQGPGKAAGLTKAEDKARVTPQQRDTVHPAQFVAESQRLERACLQSAAEVQLKIREESRLNWESKAQVGGDCMGKMRRMPPG